MWPTTWSFVSLSWSHLTSLIQTVRTLATWRQIQMLHMTNLSRDLIYLPLRYMSSMLRNSKFVFRITWKTEVLVYVHECGEFTTDLFSKVSTRNSLPYVQIKEWDIISRKRVYGVRNIFGHVINYFPRRRLVWIYVLHKKCCLELVYCSTP